LEGEEKKKRRRKYWRWLSLEFAYYRDSNSNLTHPQLRIGEKREKGGGRLGGT